MKLNPRNRHILVQPIVEEKKEENKSNILLPDDY